MKNIKPIIVFAIAMILVLLLVCPFVYGVSEGDDYDDTLPADTQTWNTAALSIRNNFAAISDNFGMSTGTMVVNVKAYGAVGDGVADDTAACQAAFVVANAASQNGTAGIYGQGQGVGSAPILYFPTGVYSITTTAGINNNTQMNYMRIVGDNAILVAADSDTTTEFFNSVRYMVEFRDITFRNGELAIKVVSGNVDGAKISIARCEFHNQDDYSVWIDSTSGSSLINIYDCKFRQQKFGQTEGTSVRLESGVAHITDCWVTSHVPTEAFYVGATARMHLNNILGVPDDDMDHWITNYGFLYVNNFRFGGEDGGRTLVHNYASGGGKVLSLDNCPFSSSAEYAIRFFDFPDHISIQNMQSPTAAVPLGIWFDNDITYARIQDWVANGTVNIEGTFDNRLNLANKLVGEGAIGRAAANAFLTKSRANIPFVEESFTESDLMVSDWRRPSPAWGITFAGTRNSTTDDRGVIWETFTATADAQNIAWTNPSYITLAGSAGVGKAFTLGDVYTLNWPVEITNSINPIQLFIMVGNTRREFSLQEGEYVLQVPFVYLNDTGGANTTLDRLRVNVSNLIDTESLRFGRFTILKGNRSFDQVNYRMEGAAVPSDSDFSYAQGDVVYDTSPDVGGLAGWINIAEGSPGSWSQFGSIEVAVVDLDLDDIKALTGSPFTLVAAPGAGLLLEFISAVLAHDAATAYVEPSAPDDMVIEYSTGTDLTASIDATGFLTVTDDEIRRVPTTLALTTDLVPEINKSIRLLNTGTNYTTGTGDLRIITTYKTLIDLGL